MSKIDLPFTSFFSFTSCTCNALLVPNAQTKGRSPSAAPFISLTFQILINRKGKEHGNSFFSISAFTPAFPATSTSFLRMNTTYFGNWWMERNIILSYLSIQRSYGEILSQLSFH